MNDDACLVCGITIYIRRLKICYRCLDHLPKEDLAPTAEKNPEEYAVMLERIRASIAAQALRSEQQVETGASISYGGGWHPSQTMLSAGNYSQGSAVFRAVTGGFLSGGGVPVQNTNGVNPDPDYEE